MLRKAVQSDIAQLAQIAFELHEIHVNSDPTDFRSMPQEYFRERLSEYLQSEDQSILVHDDGGVNAYAAVKLINIDEPTRYPRRVCMIDCFAVKESFRRRGIGKSLMAFVSQYAKEQGCTDLRLGVKSFNKDAYNFYKSVGFNERTKILDMKIL